MEESAGLLCQRNLSGLLTKNYPPSVEGFSRNPSAFAHSELVQLSFVKRSGCYLIGVTVDVESAFAWFFCVELGSLKPNASKVPHSRQKTYLSKPCLWYC